MDFYYCPYCGSALDHSNVYGIQTDAGFEKTGDILHCSNAVGFASEREAREYNPDYEGDWRDIICESEYHYVSGSFYTENDILMNGYPC